MSTGEVASTLGVTVQQVRRLTESGELTRLARGLIDRDSVERYVAERRGSRTRVWAEHTAWGAVGMLSGVVTDWLGPTQASRVRRRLREITDPADLVTLTRDRATARVYTGHPSARGRLRGQLVATDPFDLGLVGLPSDDLDGYLAAGKLESTVRFFGLVADPVGDITIRATTFAINIIDDLATQNTVLAALDAATSRDPRERGVGERILADALERYRR
ncbi:MAG: helix-turn-helix domain-containing protein [Dermatophilaceae bacterium]